MKKILSIMMSIALLTAALAGCSAGTAEKKGDMVTVGISQFAAHGSLDNCKAGFLEGLKEGGFVEGENLIIDEQNAQAEPALTNQIAQTFVGSGVDLICAIATPAAQAAFNAAEGKGIPVVYTAVTDPKRAMLTSGDVTGTSDKLPVKAQLELMRAVLPDAKKVGILYTTSETNSTSTIETYKELASTYGFEIIDMGIASAADLPLAVDSILTKVDCITNLTDNTVVSSLPMILDKANTQKIPVFGSEIEQVKMGCVAAEGIEYVDLGKQTGKMAAKILKGEATASEIPFEIIKESYLYINYDVAKGFGMTIPKELEERAIDATK